MLPGDAPLVKGPQARKTIAFFRSVFQPVYQKTPCETFSQIYPVKPPDPGIVPEPLFENTRSVRVSTLASAMSGVYYAGVHSNVKGK